MNAILAMTYTASEMVMVIGAFGVLIGGLGAIIVNIVVALKTTHKIDEGLKKTDGLASQVKEVHTLTNSNLSAVKAELALATAQIASLHEVVMDLKAEREKMAIAAQLRYPPSTPGINIGDHEAKKVVVDQKAENRANTSESAPACDTP